MSRFVLQISPHADFEMSRRGISHEEVESIFSNPQQKIRLEGKREIWQNLMESEGKRYVMRLVIDFGSEPVLVTAYKSSKIEKYWKEEP